MNEINRPPPQERKQTGKGSKEPTFELQRDKKDSKEYGLSNSQLKESTRPS